MRVATPITTALLLALTCSLAFAGGINLAWDECSGGGGPHGKVSNCLSNTGSQVLVGSFVLSQPILQFNGVEVTLDVVTDTANPTPTLPPWWDFPNPEHATYCRDALSMTFDFSVLGGGCADPFTGQVTAGGLGVYHEGQTSDYTPGANRAWMKGAGAVADPVALQAGVEYYAARVVIRNLQTIGTGACSGCYVDAALTITQVRAAGYDRSEILTAPAVLASAYWQNPPDATRNATWGLIKSLYR